MKQFILLPKLDYDLKFRAKECGDNINTEIKKTLNTPREGSDFKLAIFNRLKNIEKVLNNPKSPITNPNSPPKSKNPTKNLPISSPSTTLNETDSESVASSTYDNAVEELLNEKSSSSLLAKLKSETPLDLSKIEDEKLILPSSEKPSIHPKLRLKMPQKQKEKHGDHDSTLIEQITGSGKIDLLPNGHLFNKVTETTMPLQEFYHILAHWNKRLSDVQTSFLKPIIGLLHLSDVKNKMVKQMIEEDRIKKNRGQKTILGSPKSQKKRWLTTSPY